MKFDNLLSNSKNFKFLPHEFEISNVASFWFQNIAPNTASYFSQQENVFTII